MADVLERALPHWGKEELHTAQFENGFRVIYKHVDRPVTHCGLVINAGTRDEIAAQGEAGVAHFIEHTLFKGTRKRKAFHVLNRLDSVGVNSTPTRRKKTRGYTPPFPSSTSSGRWS